MGLFAVAHMRSAARTVEQALVPPGEVPRGVFAWMCPSTRTGGRASKQSGAAAPVQVLFDLLEAATAGLGDEARGEHDQHGAQHSVDPEGAGYA